MTDTSGPRRDEPSAPQTAVPMWVEPAKPGATYPPGFEPGGPEQSYAEPTGADPRAGGPAPVDAVVPPKRAIGRRPVVAGVVGGVLVALLGFGGGYAAGHLTGGDDGGQFSTQGVSQLAPNGEGHGDGDRVGGPGPQLLPGGSLPNAGSQESGTDT